MRPMLLNSILFFYSFERHLRETQVYFPKVGISQNDFNIIPSNEPQLNNIFVRKTDSNKVFLLRKVFNVLNSNKNSDRKLEDFLGKNSETFVKKFTKHEKINMKQNFGKFKNYKFDSNKSIIAEIFIKSQLRISKIFGGANPTHLEDSNGSNPFQTFKLQSPLPQQQVAKQEKLQQQIQQIQKLQELNALHQHLQTQTQQQILHESIKDIQKLLQERIQQQIQKQIQKQEKLLHESIQDLQQLLQGKIQQLLPIQTQQQVAQQIILQQTAQEQHQPQKSIQPKEQLVSGASIEVASQVLDYVPSNLRKRNQKQNPSNKKQKIS